MAESVRKYRVFIASPGDVAREREIAREVVQRISDQMGSRLGVVLEPVRWESHTAIDARRLQESITRLVRECDIFIGILWSRFGTPTGEAESGTQEEFDTADALLQQSGDRPTMWVFFSDIPIPPSQLLSDEGDRQWRRTREFRRRFEQEGRAALTYHDVHEFERLLRDQLGAWLAQRLGPLPAAAEVETEQLRQQYLEMLSSSHAHLPLAGFETTVRVPIDLERVFVPVRARIDILDRQPGMDDKLLRETRDVEAGAQDFRAAWQVALQRDIRLVTVLGLAGSGKTTLLKHMTLLCAAGRCGEIGLIADTLPIFVPLRKVQTGDDFAAALQAASDPALPGFPARFFAPALRDGRCLLLLDGLDEVADRTQREQMSRWVEALAARHPRNRIVLTARFAGYRDAPLRVPHLPLNVEPFQQKEIEAFLHGWYQAVAAFLPKSAASAEEVARQRADHLTQAILQHEQLRSVATNPLMLQIIALVHFARGEHGKLPDRRVELYKECTDVLLERWDVAKGLHSGLTAAEARQVLQPVALWMHSVSERKQAKEEELLPVIQRHAAGLRRPVDAKEFLRSVRDRSGLLTGYGVDEYGFQHLSFQEYLAAEEIRNTQRIDILVAYYDESWWREVTRLFVGLGNCFEPFVRALTRKGKLVGHESFTQECIRDALVQSAEPFLEAASARSGWRDQARSWWRSMPALSAQRYHALLAMRGLPAPELARVADRVRLLQRDADADVRRLAGSLLVLAGVPAGAVADLDPTTGRPQRINMIDGSELVLIPAGPFLAGEPAQKRTLEKAVYLARYPVTNAQYGKFLAANGATEPVFWRHERFNQPQQPVVGVSWDEASVYCKWAGLRLPTEWEWEKGARGTDGRTYPWGNEQPDATRAVFGGSFGQPAPVGSCPAGASPYGLLDMTGNVWEWTASWSDDRGVVRGGPFFVPPQLLRSSVRGHYPPDPSPDVGFRCAQDP